jgi:hypothetical protein
MLILCLPRTQLPSAVLVCLHGSIRKLVWQCIPQGEIYRIVIPSSSDEILHAILQCTQFYKFDKAKATYGNEKRYKDENLSFRIYRSAVVV